MTEWNVVLLIGELLALFLLVGKPLITLNTTIATLKASVDALSGRLTSQKEDFDSFTKQSAEEHKEMRKHLEEHDLILANHSHKIQALEDK